MSENILRVAYAHLARSSSRDTRREFVADPHVHETAAGRSIVRMQQQYGGIPLVGGDVAMLIDGENVELLGDVVKWTPEGDGTPDLSASEAVTAAIGHFRAKSDRTACLARHGSLRRRTIPTVVVLASFPFPSRPTVLRAGRTEIFPAAHLAWHLVDGTPRLAWVVRASLRAQSYLLMIAATSDDKGRVLLCTRWSAGARCFGTIVPWDHTAAPTRMEFPMSAAGFPRLLPHANAAFAVRPWVALDRIAGNNALGFDRNKESAVKASTVGTDLVFPQAAPTSKELTLLTAFYYCNFLHDFFLLLGFGEAEGNFQLENFASTKGGNDRLEVRVFEQKHDNLADMDAKDDGRAARLTLGLAPNKEPSGLHAELVVHEYTHGVVHRMVGGRLGALWLIQQQSLAMDEGWGDYFAITVRNHYLGNVPNYRFADWAGTSKKFRTASYDPAVLRDYASLKKKTPVTHAGEIFAAALIRFNEFLGAKLQDIERGHCIGWRAVIESLRLVEPNPHFLQGREALVRAINELERGNVISAAEAVHARDAAREGFAQYGMGRNASSENAAFGGTKSDFNV